MTDAELIAQLKTLKEIKPSATWSSSVKAQMLKPGWRDIVTGILNVAPQMQMAYAFSALLLVFAGAFGLAQFTLPGTLGNLFPANQTASLTPQAIVQTKVDAYKRSTNKVAAAKDLAAAIVSNPATAKSVALELTTDGTLAAITNSPDAKEGSDIVYQSLLEQLIKDGEKTTFSAKAQDIFNQVKQLDAQGEYAKGLELYFTITN